MLKKVLLVEDRDLYAKIIMKRLEGKVLVFWASDQEKAKEIFKENPDIDGVIMDACVPGHRPNTHRLIREIRKTFSGPMIATSGLPSYREEILQEGCSHEVRQKEDAAEMILRLLKIS